MTQVLENVKSAWENFKGEKWKAEIDVRDFILNNVNVYEGEDSFLAEATEATKQLWDQVMDLTTRNVKTVAFLIWIQKLFLLLLHMDQDI